MFFTLSKAAEADLLNIWRYTCHTWDENQADKYLDELETVCANIQSGQLLEKAMPDTHADLRYCHHGRHFVFFGSIPSTNVKVHNQRKFSSTILERLPDEVALLTLFQLTETLISQTI